MKLSHLLLSLLLLTQLASCGKNSKAENNLVNGMQAQEAFSAFTTTPSGSCATGTFKSNFLMFQAGDDHDSATIAIALKDDNKAVIYSEEIQDGNITVHQFTHTSWSINKTALEIAGFGTGTYSTVNDQPTLSISVASGSDRKIGLINFTVDNRILEGGTHDVIFKSLESEESMNTCLKFEKELSK